MIFAACLFLLSTVHSVYVEQYINHAMSLGWEYTEDQTAIIFTIKCKSGSYCAIGFGKTMYDTDFLVGFMQDTSVFMLDMWSLGHEAPVNDADIGGQYSITPLGFTINDDTFEVKGSRLLDTGDEYDKKLHVGIKTDLCWAWFSSFRYHYDNYGVGELTLGLDYGDLDKENIYDHDYKLHGIVMSVCWGIFGVIAIILARYFKQYWIWLWAHLVLGVLIVVFTIYSTMEIYKDNEGIYYFFSDVKREHSRVGILVMVLVGAQGFLGFMSAFLVWKKKPIYQKVVMRKAHQILGYTLTIVGLWNLWTGWEMYDDDVQGLMTALYSVVGVTFFLLETRHQASIHFPKIKYLDCRRANIPEMTHKVAMDKILREEKKWVFYDELVLDVGPFVNSHPGGAVLIKHAYGEDMGKYINGCSSYGEHYLPYTHTNQARDLAQRLAIAKIPYPEEIFIKKSPKIDFGNMNWVVASKKMIARDTLYIKLASFALGIQHDAILPTHFGKHFMITANVEGRTLRRYYSAMFVDYEKWSNQVLGVSLKINQDSLNVSSADDEDNHKLTSYLQLIMKVYDKGAFTQYLHQSPMGLNLTLKGPIGPGLSLSSDCRGRYMALAGGTGLVPILDLAHLIWVHHQSGSNYAGQINLFIYACFRSYSEGIAVDLLRECAERCPNLIVHFNFSDGLNSSQEKLSRELLHKHEVMHMDQIWVCGPSGFNRWAFGLLHKEGVKREKIMIL